MLTDDNENVLVRYEYDVFGAIRAEAGASDNPRKFTGKEWEADVGLYHMGARPYDPYIGRFTQRDPIGDGLNWYAYAYNNPMKYVDPTGMYIVLPSGAEIRAVPGRNDDGTYQKPDELAYEDKSIWNALFTGGVNRTGIAGSQAMGSLVTDIIESEAAVKIQFGDIDLDDTPGNQAASGSTDPNRLFKRQFDIRNGVLFCYNPLGFSAKTL